MYRPNASNYRDNEILSTPREQLVPLLYRHLVIRLRTAGEQIRDGDIAGKAESLSRATDIVYELLGSLDHDAGGELAERLSALYAYFLSEFREVGRSMDAARLETTLELIDSLHEAWARAADEVVGERSGGRATGSLGSGVSA